MGADDDRSSTGSGDDPDEATHPRHWRVEQLLPEVEHRVLVDLITARLDALAPSGVYGHDGTSELHDERQRRSRGTADVDQIWSLVRPHIEALVPEAARRLGITEPIDESVECEVSVYGDGDFFARHTDAEVVPGGAPAPGDRLLSFVLYVALAPRTFTGGQLRLHHGETDAARCTDIDPTDDALVLFPAWTSHEVLPVHAARPGLGALRANVHGWLHRAPTP